jgi:3-phenylpropionate/trans-cinnamate dioxygenase ferredoxin reductase subunit
VRILEGSVQSLGPISRAHVSADEESRGYTLACRVAPTCAVRLEVAAKLRKPFSKPFAIPANTLSTDR